MTKPPIADNRVYQERHAEDAEEFLGLLTPHQGGPLYDRPGHEQLGWLFRGQGDAKWKLVPSAHRGLIAPHGEQPTGEDPFHNFRAGQVTPLTITDPAELIDAEWHFVFDFINRISEIGYELPFDSAALRDFDHGLRRDEHGRHFPSRELRGVWALAQHYGIPTRFLDWTDRALIAAYFAASGPAKRAAKGDPIGADDRFAVWALHRSYPALCCGHQDMDVTLVTVPKHTNPNLAAQRGLFTLVRYKDGPLRIPPALDDLLRSKEHWEAVVTEAVAKKNVNLPLDAVLYKLTCPKSQARRVMHYLSLSGVDAASIYAGHGSVADAMKEVGVRSVTRPSRRQG